MRITSVAHVCIKSTDLAATRAFYCDTLGLVKRFDFTRKGKVVGHYLQAANRTFVEVFLAEEIERIDKQVLHHFCFETDSLAELHQQIVERGFEAGAIKLGADQTAQFWMKDPDGMDVEFQEYSPESAQLTGRDVEVNW